MDRVQKMVEKQKEREEQMKKKEAEEQAKANAQKSAQNATYMATKAAAAPTQAAALPTDTWFTMRKTLYAPLPPTTRGKPTVLGGDPSGKNILICLGNNVIIRSLDNPLDNDIYSEHVVPTTVARFSPDGKFVASGDTSGTIRVWHTEIIQGTVHKLKLEKKTLGGAILDLSWDNESKRILAVGQGRDKFGLIFFAESGAGAGEITGHSKAITTCDYRPAKPHRLITGGEDFIVNWFEGPPFKFKHSIQNFSNFVNCARFSPDGSRVFVVGQDKKGVFLDGDSGQVLYELDASSAHTGGIYACSFSPDGSKVLTVSGDKTAKIWDASSGKCLDTYAYGNQIEDQLLGCIWQGDHKVVMNLAGHLLYLPPSSSQPPLRIIKGHNKTIEAMVYDTQQKRLYSGSYDTVTCQWNLETGEAVDIQGKGHTNAIKRLALQKGGAGQLVSASLDDSIRVTPLDKLHYESSHGFPLDGPPAGVGVGHHNPELIVTATNKSVHVITYKSGSFSSHKKEVTNLSAQAVALSTDDKLIAVGQENNNITLFAIKGNDIAEDAVLKAHRGPITRLDFSPCGKYLASSDRNREVIVWDVASRQVKVKDWVYHTARIDALAFSPSSTHVATGGLDQQIIVWSLENPTNRITIKGAHQGGITEIVWLDNSTIASTGQDCTIRTWTVL